MEDQVRVSRMNLTLANLSNQAGCTFQWKPKEASFKIAATFACCLIFFVSFAGNFLIAVTVYRTPRLRLFLQLRSSLWQLLRRCFSRLASTSRERYVISTGTTYFGESSSFKDYIVVFFVGFVFFPITLLAILYYLIMVKLRSQKILGEQTVIAQKQLARRNRKDLKMATAIWLVFMLCWLPWSIFNLSLNHITRGANTLWLFLFT